MLRVSPQKLNLLAQLIRGKKVATALADLEFSRKRISVEVKKTLEFAIANAENNHILDVDDLVVAQAWVGKDMVLKRFARARAACGWAHREAVRQHHHRRAGSRHRRRQSRLRGKTSTMGQKINPIGLRLGVNRTWDLRWYSSKGEYGKLLHEDMKIRDLLTKSLKQAAISKIVIDSRPHKKARIDIYPPGPASSSARRGPISRSCASRWRSSTNSEVAINIVEVRKPEIDATLVAELIAQQLERRVAFRCAIEARESAMRLGAEGIRINCSGRLGGAEIARQEWYREGRVPLHTLLDVDYGVATAHTAYGTCGIKVWIFKGEILQHDPMAQDKRLAEADHSSTHRPRREPREHAREAV